MLKKLINAIKKYLKPLFTPKMIPYVLVGELLYWSPLIVIATLAVFQPELWVLFGAVYGVWVFLLPAIPIQVLFILTIYKIHKWLKAHASPDKENNNDTNNP